MTVKLIENKVIVLTGKWGHCDNKEIGLSERKRHYAPKIEQKNIISKTVGN